MTYASSLKTIEDLLDDRVSFYKLDIANELELSNHIDEGVDLIVHFAAESFNDKSLHDTSVFVKSNIVGTHNLLELARKYDIRFHHISTDEVYGDFPLESKDKFTEKNAVQSKFSLCCYKGLCGFIGQSLGSFFWS